MKTSMIHFGIVVGAVLALGIGYLFWYGAVSSKSAEVASLQEQITSTTETVSRIASTKAALARLAVDEAKVQGYFVSESGVVAFINALQAIGTSQQSTVTVTSVSTGGTKARPALTFELGVDGPFDAVMRTVGAVEYAPYAITVTGLAVREDATNKWHADLGLSVGSITATTTKP